MQSLMGAGNDDEEDIMQQSSSSSQMSLSQVDLDWYDGQQQNDFLHVHVFIIGD